MTFATPTSTVIIGAGIFGVSTAVQLARRGVAVTLINDGPVANGASGRSLSWLNSSRRRSREYHDLRMAGMDRYRTLSARLGRVDWLHFDGGLTWDADDDSNDIADAFAHEVSMGYDAVHLNADEIADWTPGTDTAAVTPEGAIFNPGEGWVDLPSLIAHLLTEFAALGGTLITDEGAAEVIAEDGRAIGARTGNALHLADVVMLATGPSVPAMAAKVGVRIDDGTPLALLIVTEPAEHPLRAVLNTPRVAIRPAPGNRFSLDADWAAVEGVAGKDGAYLVDPAVVEDLLAEASKVLEGHPRLKADRWGAGRKPIPGDGEPVIGAVTTLPGLYVAFSHSGATLGLIVGEMAAYEIVTGARHPMLATFRPERFA
ncbi:NAD(P)/FAD-dependent oxidoreductase [Paenirhodobacter populi]|uniref:FAD-binding oxidoreductase n=1 Tax=Paenirhodobacter populi TaxID=2306993 RepID=A0A443J568_9RHOB|nr:FAD-binding oxidoreductase [Sinirhodobacter populi]RWR15456.1 FAD-binding oxidoreductase [Sinirhodobacter populi]